MDGPTTGTPDAARAYRLPLTPVPEAVRHARTLLREAVAGTRFAARLAAGELALTELVTNAVLHGREPIEVTLHLTAAVLRCEVSDANPVSPSFSMLDPLPSPGAGSC